MSNYLRRHPAFVPSAPLPSSFSLDPSPACLPRTWFAKVAAAAQSGLPWLLIAEAVERLARISLLFASLEGPTRGRAVEQLADLFAWPCCSASAAALSPWLTAQLSHLPSQSRSALPADYSRTAAAAGCCQTEGWSALLAALLSSLAAWFLASSAS